METEKSPINLANMVFEAMNRRDFSHLEQVITGDVIFDFPGVSPLEGSRRVVLFLKALLRRYPRLEFDVKEILVDRDRACAVWTNEGADREGKPYSNSGVTLLHCREGKIAFISDYFKDTSFTQT